MTGPGHKLTLQEYIYPQQDVAYTHKSSGILLKDIIKPSYMI